MYRMKLVATRRRGLCPAVTFECAALKWMLESVPAGLVPAGLVPEARTREDSVPAGLVTEEPTSEESTSEELGQGLELDLAAQWGESDELQSLP